MDSTTEAQTLTIEDRFSISEKRVEPGFSDDEVVDLNESSHDVLSAIVSFEKMTLDKSKSITKKDPEEINRVEQKLDLLTELMTSILVSRTALPNKKRVEMSVENLVWHPEIEIEKGQFCLVSIYLTRKYPLPLQLPVIITKKGKTGIVEGEILLSDELVMDDLARLIFLFHRRQIARNKTRSE